jgi:acyl carrier protein
MKMTLLDRVRSMLAELGDGAELTDVQDVFATGVLSSLCLLELICCLEDELGVVVSQRDVFDGRLKSINRIVELVAERQS